MHVEGKHDMSVHRPDGVRDEPVATDLRDEPAEPGAELDPLGVELDVRTETAGVATVVAEGLALDTLTQVFDRLTKQPVRRQIDATLVGRIGIAGSCP